MPSLETLGELARAALDQRSVARDRCLALSRETIRTCANAIRAGHRGELLRAGELLATAANAMTPLAELRDVFPDLYGAGYVHDCQKEYAEGRCFISLLGNEPLPSPAELGVEWAAYLNGLGETIGELRRHTLDVMRRGELEEAERILGLMDEIYYLLVTLDYSDGLTGGLRRTTDASRGIIEKTRGELTTALQGEELRKALNRATDMLARGSAESL